MGIKLISILKTIIKEQEEVDSSVGTVLSRFPVLKYVLKDLLTSSGGDEYSQEEDLEKLISKIEVIVFKPTTFKIDFKNGSSMNLKYDPTPMELDPKEKSRYKPKDYFHCMIVGKKYNLSNQSQYEQAISYIAKALSEKPIGSGNNQATKDEDLPDEEPDTDVDDNDDDDGE